MKPWIAWGLLALVAWGVWSVLNRAIGDALSPAQSQIVSTVGMLPILLVLIPAWRRSLQHGLPRGAAWAAGAGLLAGLGNVAYYHALNSGPTASSVIALTALYPLVTVVLALVVLGETLNATQQLGILVSLVAIVLFNIASARGIASPWLLFALAPIALWGLAGLAQKLATTSLDGHASTAWFLGGILAASVVLATVNPWPGPITPRVWLLAGALGFTFALGNLALLFAFARGGRASVLTPMSGLYPAVGIPMAMACYHEYPGPRETAGILLSLIAVTLLALETRPPAQPDPVHPAPPPQG